MLKFLIIFFLICCGLIFVGGCHKQGVDRPKGTQPFVPVHIEFTGLDKDTTVEREIEKRLFCRDCLFLRVDTTVYSPYTLRVQYDRRIDLKSLGIILLSAALAPFEAEFSYCLRVQVMEDDMVLKEYNYERITREMTDSAFGRIFNPFHKVNGRSEEIFGELTDSFLREVLVEKPLPQVGKQR